MPSPLAHALAGATIAWASHPIQARKPETRADSRLLLACVGLAMAADCDLMYPPIHRTMTHSVVAVVVVGLVARLFAGRVSLSHPWRVAAVCGLAYASHLGMDLVGADTKLPAGIQLFWPVSHHWYIAPWSLFRAMHLGGFFTARNAWANVLALGREVLVMGPLALLAFLASRRVRSAG